MKPDEVRKASRLATRSAVVGGVLMVLAVVGTVTRWLPDLLSTVLGIAGVALLIYALALAVLVLIDREPMGRP